ncbi:MAG: stage II sporulation protein P [Tyzzerella sp.]|nr:stage II sporulation protein P [Tyzzerella sp.]
MLGICVLALGIYVLFQGGARIIEEWKRDFQNHLAETTEKTFLPGIYYTFETDEDEKENWLEKQIAALLPIFGYMSDTEVASAEIEDSLTYEMILEQQAKDAERMSEDLLEEQPETTQVNATTTAADLSIEKLRDFNYLLSKFYTVDSTTTIGADQLNVDELLSKDMHIDTSTKGPKVLIFHTHSQEEFADSVAGDASTTIVGMGAYLAQKLNEKGIETMHHDGVYDLIDGKLDRSKAYELSEIGVKEILNQNPSIEVVIDLHRDGVSEDLHLVTEVDGKQTAKIMFFNGLSRTKANGDIAYLYNPYIQDNLSFSFQMQLASETMYPGLARRIYLKGYRYSLHMMPKSLLIEAGAQTNTVEEMKNAMDLLANILQEVLAS